MTQKTKIKMENKVNAKSREGALGQEMKSFSKRFFKQYGHTKEREIFFKKELPRFAEKVCKKDIDIEKELWNFIDEYKAEGLGGYNSTYGNIYHWLIDLAAIVLGKDAHKLRSSLVY